MEQDELDEAIFQERGWEFIGEAKLYYDELRTDRLGKRLKEFMTVSYTHLDVYKRQEVKRSAFEVMADWQQQELSIRMSALEACNPDELFSEEVEKIISATLSTLSEPTRRAFILSRFENKSNKEIAEEMEISIKAVSYTHL